MSGLPGAGTCPGLGEASDLKSPLGAKFREPLTEARFQQLFGDAEPEPELPAEPRGSRPCGRWARWARSGPGAGRLLRARLPLLRWLPRYRWRAWLLGDAVAGVTVGIVHVPQGERPQRSPARGPAPEGVGEAQGLGTRGAEGAETGCETKFWVRTTALQQVPTPKLPSFAQSSQKSWTRLGSGTWREAQHPHPDPPAADKDL